jgi:hypothetical protein
MNQSGPGRTRTSNQTVMSAVTSSEMPIKSGFSRRFNQRTFAFSVFRRGVLTMIGKGVP